jgi:hypothetical protein
VQHGEHDDNLVRHPKINGVREGVQQRSAHIAGHHGELKRPLAQPHERPIDIFEKPLGEPWSLLVVLLRGILEIGLGERPNDEPAGHSIQ